MDEVCAANMHTSENISMNKIQRKRDAIEPVLKGLFYYFGFFCYKTVLRAELIPNRTDAPGGARPQADLVSNIIHY